MGGGESKNWVDKEKRKEETLARGGLREQRKTSWRQNPATTGRPKSEICSLK